MLNPYARLTPKILKAMLRQPMFFVRQSYRRGATIGPQQKNNSFLLTHYAQHAVDEERAERHIRLLYKDPYRFLYDSTNPEHFARLMQAASPPKSYAVYINLLPQKWKANETLKKQIGMYVQQKLSWWNFSPSHKLQVTLKERYGELFIALLWKGQQTEVHLDVIENLQACATT